MMVQKLYHDGTVSVPSWKIVFRGILLAGCGFESYYPSEIIVKTETNICRLTTNLYIIVVVIERVAKVCAIIKIVK